ncbi:MAG: hypothetical protein N2246_02550, partial [Candidatus Sumerlaeia bacterium]|nr:hypothetical protein [Candidatus Sumerlaeia bacterium]
MNRKLEYLFCSEAWTPTHKLNNVVFRISAGYIAEINSGTKDDELNNLPSETTLVGRDLICAPGLVDEHIQGAGGYDFLQASIEGNKQILETAVRGGTTELLATITISNQDKDLKQFYQPNTYDGIIWNSESCEIFFAPDLNSCYQFIIGPGNVFTDIYTP